MILTESFLADAGWLFFAAWSAVVTVVSIIAFGRDLLPSKTPLDPQDPHVTDAARLAGPRTRSRRI